MTTRATIDDFIAQRTLAVVGVSRGGKKFGSMVFRELRAKEYRVIPINPHAKAIEGEPCFPSLSALPEPADGVVIVVPPGETERVVLNAVEAGIRRIWMQQGAESAAAVQFCKEQGIDAVHGECILMFARPSAMHHRLHRWVWGLLGRLPE